MSKLLKALPLETSTSTESYVHYQLAKPHYLDLKQNLREITQFEIKLLTEEGSNIKFLTPGIVRVLLHFLNKK